MSDTITAVATGDSVSAIGIIRISGTDSIDLASSIFKPSSGVSLRDAKCRQMYYGELCNADGQLLDLCMCMISRAPDSYTGENCVEFHCHGSPIVLSEILHVLFAKGIRHAEAGEFTKRAFLNGRMDLPRAEAVIDLIDAETPAAAYNAVGQLAGAISEDMNEIYSSLVDIMAHFHAVIDYPDEDIDEFRLQEYLVILENANNKLQALLDTHSRGRILRDGIPTAIVGRPNTGKSSLLNALLGYERAIVTDIAGTTRDTVEEKVLLGGVLLRLIDTAGLRNTVDTVEQLGVERTHVALKSAKLIIVVLDGSEPLTCEDYEVLDTISANFDVPKIAVVNKSDLPAVLNVSEIENYGFETGVISALTGDGLSELEIMLNEKFPVFGTVPTGELITNARQADAILRAKNSIGTAIESLTEAVTPDAVLTDIEASISAIGEVTGEVMREDIISRIFERFCVGK